MSLHRYPSATLLPHYVRAIAGFTIAAALVLFAGLSSAMLWVAGPIAILFLAFGLTTALRHGTVIEVTADGISSRGPFGRAIRWQDVEKVELRFYSTKKDRSDGWMQLNVGSSRRRLAIESNLEGFEAVVQAVVNAASARGVVLNAASQANLRALGIAASDGAEPGRWNG